MTTRRRNDFKLNTLRILSLLVLVLFASVLQIPTAFGQIFVGESREVGEFSTSGSVINGSLVSGPGINPLGVAANTAGQLFVSTAQSSLSENSVGSYTFSGAPINSTLITLPFSSVVTSIAVDGQGDILVANASTGTIGEYSTSGAVISASLITGLSSPGAMAFDGLGHLFVLQNITGIRSSIGEYTTSGALVNASLVTGLYDPAGLAINNQGDMFVSLEDNGEVAEYSTSGSLIDSSFLQGLNQPSGLAIDGEGNLFVVQTGAGSVGEYTTTGTVLNASLIDGLTLPYNITVVPEPSSSIMLVAGVNFIFAGKRFLGLKRT